MQKRKKTKLIAFSDCVLLLLGKSFLVSYIVLSLSQNTNLFSFFAQIQGICSSGFRYHSLYRTFQLERIGMILKNYQIVIYYSACISLVHCRCCSSQSSMCCGESFWYSGCLSTAAYIAISTKLPEKNSKVTCPACCATAKMLSLTELPDIVELNSSEQIDTFNSGFAWLLWT